MDERRLDQRHEWIGQWWLPGDPETKVAGMLTFDADSGIRLRLIGGWEYRDVTELAPGVTVMHQDFQSWSIIHGRSGTEEITLVDTYVRGARGPYGGPPDELDIDAMTLLVGCHLDAPDSPIFLGGAITVENLTGWARRGKWEERVRKDEPARPHESVTADVGDITAELHSWADYRSSQLRRDAYEVRTREHNSVEFSSVSSRHMNVWFELFTSVSDLMSLSTLSACSAITLRLFLPPRPGEYAEGHLLANARRPVDVFQKHIVTPDLDGKPANVMEFILTEADLPFPILFPAWLDVRDRFSAARGLILGLRYVTGGYLETRVSTAVSAAEAFHRALNPPPPIPPAEFSALRRALLLAVDPARKQWLNDRLQFNEPTLKQRLFELVERPGPFMSELVPDPATWARAAVLARNDLAHRGKTEPEYEKLHAVVQVTAAVVIMNLLKEIGVPSDRLAAALQEHPDLRWARDLAREHLTKNSDPAITEGQEP